MNKIDISGLGALMKDVPPSGIMPVKPEPPPKDAIVDVNTANKTKWGNVSNQLLNDYIFGESFATYGNSNLDIKILFKRLSSAIESIIANEHQKQGQGAEYLKSHFDILEACLEIIANEILKKDLKDFNTLSIISSLQGFICNYVKSNNKRMRTINE